MASTPSAKPGRILAKAMSDRLGRDGPDDCITFSRCNGREFQIEMSPFYICNSPAIESRYRKFLAAVRDEWEFDTDQDDGEHPETVIDDFHAWLINVFEPVFLEVAPDIPPSFDPAKIATGEAHPLLSEYFFPEEYRCRLEAEADKPFPILMRDAESRWVPPLNYIEPELVQRVGQYVKFFRPSEVEVSFKKPDHALSESPTRVLVELDDSGRKTLCFLKTFAVGGFLVLEKELEAHLRILQSSLAHDVRIARLRGVVAVDEDTKILGLLLTYINHRRENDGLLFEDCLLHTPIPLRQRWARQIQETVAQLHSAGLVWGDAKAENVIIDKNNDAWLIDFGGGYTEGWVDKDKAGTAEGDLQGVAKIVEHLSNEEYEPYPDSDDWEEDDYLRQDAARSEAAPRKITRVCTSQLRT
ncbi:uncharacterized protein THITE_2129274 [Thermothielavioides terrestris NRRL 8126]|uniref:Protein kinase domain-containing protein n=1 Tax=Thermothielavioides terrestris (strain ATCC 38088 / NRRL 8126) TaxID=578455 RepID=G2R167_THETT|nr:uncharacterized protein THITE_2129274 [Thermothielavioides terrestris NRRL 8126]AEO67357.1 hypothetical protein THITE_2129274 [Thermothielavioides terrestris NRRL 8126]